MKQKAFLICPIRNTAIEYELGIEAQLEVLEKDYEVHYPKRDTNQLATELQICEDNRKAIEAADVVFFIWDGKSQGCLFDLGMAFAMRKPVKIITGYMPPMTRGKSFQNMAYAWEESESEKRFALPDNIVFGYVPSPGRIICDELKARGWSQRDLADMMVRPIQIVNDIINAKTEIITEIAIELGAAFGTSADFWLNLEKDYRLWLEGQESEEWCLLPSQLKKPQGYFKKYKLKKGCYDKHGGSLPSVESEE